jgi:hypothetical protein
MQSGLITGFHWDPVQGIKRGIQLVAYQAYLGYFSSSRATLYALKCMQFGICSNP